MFFGKVKEKLSQCPVSFFAVIAFFLPALIGFNYTANHFYIHGGITQDSAYFAFLTSSVKQWPMENPPWMSGSYFTTHFCIIFYLLSFIYKYLSFVGIHFTPAIYFSITQGLWMGLMAVAVFYLLIRETDRGNKTKLFLITILSIAAGLNGITLSALGIPHFEIGIPALLVLFFTFHLNGRKILALIVLILGLLTREDSGFHYFGVFILLTFYFCVFYWKPGKKKQILYYGVLSIVCFLASVISLVIQKNSAPSHDMLAMIYTGTPPYAHLTWEFVSNRFPFFLNNRLYILIPIVISCGWAFAKRDLLLIVGTLSVIPWIVFSVMSKSDNPGLLTSYYAFPIILMVVWPAISYKMNRVLAIKATPVYAERTLLGAILGCSIFFLPGSQFLHDTVPWESFGFDWYGKVERTHKRLEQFYNANVGRINFIADDPAVSILTDTLTIPYRRYEFDITDEDRKSIEALVFLPAPRWDERARKFINDLQLTHFCALEGTDYMVASRYTMSKDCEFLPNGLEQIFALDREDFLAKDGWFEKTDEGRWTKGEYVYFPALVNLSNDGSDLDFCIDGYGVLPTTDKSVTANVYIWGSEENIGQLTYSGANSSGERCVRIPGQHLQSERSLLVKFQIDGHSSSIADVERPVLFHGIFIRKIILRKK